MSEEELKLKKGDHVKVIDLLNQQFGRLKVISFSHIDKKCRTAKWNCLCDCGNTSIVFSTSLRRGTTKSCGCLHKEIVSQKGGWNKLGIGEANSWSLYLTYKKSAYKRNIKFDLSYSDFIVLTSKNCFYCAVPPLQRHKKNGTNGHYLYNGIDRVNSDFGYILNNIVSCCKKCNYAKRQMTLFEFKKWIKKVFNNMKLEK